MTQPSIQEFERQVRNEPLDEVVRKTLFEGDPYVFREQPDALKTLRSHVCERLKVPETSFAIVGSAKLGFSASPDTFARPFTENSDIDVIIIAPELFDSVWHCLLRWNFPRRGARMIASDYQWRSGRMEEIYWGWLTPEAIPFDRIPYSNLDPIRVLKAQWFNTFRSLGRYSDFADRDVNGRLYRTWEHATLYHVDGLQRVLERIGKEK